MDSFEGYLARYGAYVEELRVRVFKIVVVFSLVFVGGFFSTNWLVKFLVGVLRIKDVTIVATSPFQLIDLAMSVGFFCAVIITLPFAVQQAYQFLRTGLLRQERKIFIRLIPLAVLLFAMGFVYGFAVMYYAVAIIAQVNIALGVANLWDISQFISQIILTATLLGVIFELPIVLTFLIRLGLLRIELLRAKRPHAIVVILILVALLPPTDGLSFIVMSVPLVGIYELTVWVNSFRTQKRIL